MNSAAQSLARDGRVLGVVGTSHFLSHFYFLTLPPLLVTWQSEFGVSFTALGLLLSVFAGATGIAQIPAGILADRFGARGVLFWGMVMEGGAIGAMGLVNDFAMLFPLVIVAGIGNSVFHPADYSILNASVAPERMGKAFSMHTFAGYTGAALAPATIIFLSAYRDWRFALIVVGALGVAMGFIILAQFKLLHSDHASPAKDKKPSEADGNGGNGGSLSLFFSRPMILFFLFFALTAMTLRGVHSFSVVAAVALHDINLTSAGTALTAFLTASAVGILIGGVMADRTERHDMIAGLAFVFSAVIFGILVTVSFSTFLLIGMFTLAGLAQGVVRPARDMMVRTLTPEGSSGRVFGFVSTGISVGGVLAPVFFGWIVDLDASHWIFWLLALFMLGATATVMFQEPGRIKA